MASSSDEPQADTNAEVDIVFPCYNAASWIDAFIETLLTQDISWRLIARDDGSHDETLAILRRWRECLGPRMLLLDETQPRNLGVIGNYDAVLAASTARWVLTADPDDVWLPNRVSLTLGALKAAEAEVGPATPVAVGTDGVVVDGDLHPVAPSFCRWMHMAEPARQTLPRLAMESRALGSTMAINRALVQAARPMPVAAAYQDWWLALVAFAAGRLIILPEATILYRRHGDNTTKDPYAASLANTVRRTLKAPGQARARLSYLIEQAARQAAAFLDCYGDRISPPDAAALRALARLPQMGPLARRHAVIRHGLWFSWLPKNIGLFMLL